MIVIVEGMDNAGKTSLIQRLAAARPAAQVRKITEGRAPTLEEIHDYVDELIARAEEGEDTVFDRHSIVSEAVYGPVLRGGSMLAEWEIDAALSWVAGAIQRKAPTRRPTLYQTTLIYCRPPTERVLDFGDRFQMEGVRERAVRLLDAYDRYFAEIVPSWPIAARTYDWTTDPRAETLIRDLQQEGRW